MAMSDSFTGVEYDIEENVKFLNVANFTVS